MPDWKEHGIRVVRAGELDCNTPQTPGMSRAAAITHARAGASKLWAGTVTVQPAARTGAHHHGELETVLYIIRGRARFRWGEQLEYVVEADPGDFIYVPPFVPHQEMNARSDVPVEAVVADVRRLVEHGYLEVVLTGVDITSYGADLPDGPRLGTLIKRILKEVPELARLRVSSIDSVEADRDLLDAFGNDERLMPHLHLSLQSGDDLILKRMKRRHLRADAIAFCDTVRQLRPDVVFGADMIAGFPTEGEAMFQNSLDLVGECGLTHLHVFPFSPRPGTPAARMPQVAREVVKDRARRLRERGALALARHLDREIGATRRILTESRDGGRTEQFTKVRLARPAEPGQILDLKIAAHDGRQLLAA